MFATLHKNSVIAFAIAGCVAFATTAEAGGYAGNGCIAKKQAALGKYVKSVGSAWIKNPTNSVLREAAITSAATKLSDAWAKNEEKAASKNASCNESTDTAVGVAAKVDEAMLEVAANGGSFSPESVIAVSNYEAAVMKAWSKYIADPLKDPGKTIRTGAIAAAVSTYLDGSIMGIPMMAAAFEADLVEATTNAPNYPHVFQTIEPGSTVLYGKETLTPRCVDDDPYMYFARKGTNNKVLMYYQGGGACWNDASCYGVGTCDRTSVPGDNPALTTTGFGDYTKPENPFHDWNIVFISYCTCDIHWGAELYNYGPGHQARHYGRINAKVAEKFAREHFADPDEVFATGSSAGSYGAIMNAYYLMHDIWPNAKYGVLGDAGVGVITQAFLDDYIAHWGVEKNFPSDLPGVSLPVESLALVDLIDGLAQKYPDSRFANYDSSYDSGSGSQSNFFQVMRNLPNLTEWGSWWKSSCQFNRCMRDFKQSNYTKAQAVNQNYRYFTGAGSRHTMFGSDKVYVETKSTRSDNDAGMTIAEWVRAMLDFSTDSDWVNVDCNNPGGNCHLTNSCQGGDNAGEICYKKCSGGTYDTLSCVVAGDCPGGTCASSNANCPGGTCQQDPDTSNAPFNNDDTVTCGPEVCPCGIANAKCVGGANDSNTCTVDAECTGGTCVNVNCSQH